MKIIKTIVLKKLNDVVLANIAILALSNDSEVLEKKCIFFKTLFIIKSFF